jgi:hypothetical protein
VGDGHSGKIRLSEIHRHPAVNAGHTISLLRGAAKPLILSHKTVRHPWLHSPVLLSRIHANVMIMYEF